jgi:purine-binding chemotaxis protein CheW
MLLRANKKIYTIFPKIVRLMEYEMKYTNNQIRNDNIEKKQYVTFSIGKEVFGIDVIRAQEVLNIIEITQVPNTMPFMKGVIDLRGKIVPLIDMRIVFKLEERLYDNNTVIIIVEVKGVICGLIVDSVYDVISMSLESIQQTQHFSTEIEKDSVTGIGRINGKLVIIIDVDKILSIDELLKIKNN